MFRLKENISPEDLGFEKKSFDYVKYVVGDDGIKKTGFTIYMGSPYIRYSKTAYISDSQLKIMYYWIKNNYIEWVDE